MRKPTPTSSPNSKSTPLLSSKSPPSPISKSPPLRSSKSSPTKPHSPPAPSPSCTKSSSTLFRGSAVAIGGRALIIAGPPGAGKSTLALSLIDRGAQLIGDDALQLAKEDGRIIAHPPPNISGLIEIRNVALASLPCLSAPLALILRLDPMAPRYIETAPTREILGCNIPEIHLCPTGGIVTRILSDKIESASEDASEGATERASEDNQATTQDSENAPVQYAIGTADPIRAEYALKLHGLPL